MKRPVVGRASYRQKNEFQPVTMETSEKKTIVGETNSKWRRKTSQLPTEMWSNLFFSVDRNTL